MVGSDFEFEGEIYRVTQFLGRGKSAYSYLMECGDKKRVLKKMHQEAVEHYVFGDKLKDEVESYGRLSRAGASIPRLISWSEEGQYLVKEYLDGPTAAELSASGSLTRHHFAEAMRMNQILRDNDIHVDYFPANFIFVGDRIYCVDYECHFYNEEWDLPNWGIFYWFNSAGMKEHLEQGSSGLLNLPERPKPVWEPFLEQRDQLLKELGYAELPPPTALWTV